MKIKIPGIRERYCTHCSSIENEGLETRKTEQEPHEIEISNTGRGCFNSQNSYTWIWKCLECGETQL